MSDIPVKPRRNRRAATRFVRKLWKRQGGVPRQLVTDKLPSDPVARREEVPSVVCVTAQYANNRDEGSHQPTRQREYQMRPSSPPVICSGSPLFMASSRICSEPVATVHHRLLRRRVFVEWAVLTCPTETTEAAELGTSVHIVSSNLTKTSCKYDKKRG